MPEMYGFLWDNYNKKGIRVHLKKWDSNIDEIIFNAYSIRYQLVTVCWFAWLF
jgi:hypothetical protein